MSEDMGAGRPTDDGQMAGGIDHRRCRRRQRRRGRFSTPSPSATITYLGGSTVTRLEPFITLAGPRGGPFALPSMDLAREKEEFASTRLRRWLGRPEGMAAEAPHARG